MKYHQPVLLKEVLEYLSPQTGENFVDCTYGFGGHSQEILKKIKPDGKILGIEGTKQVYNLNKKNNKNKNLILVNNNFVDLKKIIKKNNFGLVDGILLDLGVSSWHYENSGLGFSFQKDEPLLMSISEEGITAEEVINSWSKEDLVKIFREYGEERFAYSIAKEICEERKKQRIKTTSQLVGVIQKSVPYRYQKRKIHFATKTFQALRIAVNNELNNLEIILPQALKVLKPGGRLVVISFHSLEDRIAKRFTSIFYWRSVPSRI